MHTINSATVKTSKLTKVGKVYRGVKGGVLPECFITPNEQGARGGVERAFLSTTFDREVAMHYASDDEKPSIVFEIQSALTPRTAQMSCMDALLHGCFAALLTCLAT